MEDPLVGIVVHPTKNVSESIATLQRWNRSGRGHLVARRIDGARVGSGIETLEDDDFRERVDLVVSLGGDGTMRGAMRLVAGRPVPVIGVNYGNVGFLVEIEPPELEAALDSLSRSDFSLEPHHAIEVVNRCNAVPYQAIRLSQHGTLQAIEDKTFDLPRDPNRLQTGVAVQRIGAIGNIGVRERRGDDLDDR